MLSVLKLGGSVLRDPASYAATAAFLAQRLASHPDARLVVIVSARYGVTDDLLEEARGIASEPQAAALDLLWSTGELQSVARLTLHLQRQEVDAVPFNVHQTGLVSEPGRGTTVRPLRLLAALGSHRLVIVPGFLGVSAGGTVASLGRGGSDLTAVLLAAAVKADACELIKDVPGYHTADPHLVADARPIHDLEIEDALAMAEAGCDLVQRAALVAADTARLPLIVRSLSAAAPVTIVHARRDHGIRHQDDSRRPAVRA